MALEQGPQLIEFVENRDTVDLEEVEITPPVRRKRKEAKKNTVNTNLPGPLPASDDKKIANVDASSEDSSGSVSATPLLNEIEVEEAKGNESDISSHEKATSGFELRATKSDRFVESSLVEEVWGNAATSYGNSLENSSVEEKNLVASADETSFAVNTLGEQESNRDAESKEICVVQRESCISPDFTSGEHVSQDEESFFSAESEAETSTGPEFNSSFQHAEVLNEMFTVSGNNEVCSSASREDTDVRDLGGTANLDPNYQEPLDETAKESCTDLIPEHKLQEENLRQRSDQEAVAFEPGSLEGSSQEFKAPGTVLVGDTECHGVSETHSYCLDSELCVVDTHTEPGAVGGVGTYDSDSDDGSSYSSSWTSSEGEYDIGWAEQVRGIKEQDSEDEDSLPKDTVTQILSAFSNTEVISVAADSEDDSNKGDSLTSSLKYADEAETGPPPLLNIMDDQVDGSSTGEEILACFPPSECPVVVDNTSAGESGVSENTQERHVHSPEPEEKPCSDVRTSTETSASVDNEVVPSEDFHQTDDGALTTDLSLNFKEDTANHLEVQNCSKSSDKEDTPAIKSTNPVSRSGSLRLVNNNGILKIVGCSETPVTTENVKEARILRNPTLKGGGALPGQDAESVEIDSDCDKAARVLSRTVSEVRKMDDDDGEDFLLNEIHSVCEDIAKLESMSKGDNEDALVECESVDSSPGKDSHLLSLESSHSDKLDSPLDAGSSGTVVISVDSVTLTKLKPLTDEGDSNADHVDKMDNSASSNSSILTGSNDQIDGSVDGSGGNVAVVKKQRPRRLAKFKRYSLDTEAKLLSPEDDIHAELTKFESNSSLNGHSSPVLTSNTQTTSVSEALDVTTDGQQREAEVTPSPPPRMHNLKLRYSASFSSSGAPARLAAPKENKRPKRVRSDRWKTMPNNTFDPFARISAAFKLSSAPAETLHQGPLTLITDEMAATFTNFPQQRRAQVALELYTTERSYVRGLETIIQLFKKPCEERKLLDKKESQTIFHNIEDIFKVNKDVLFHLLERMNHWQDHQCVGDIFLDQALKIFDRMKIYAEFCNNYDSAETLYKQKVKRSKEFEAFLNSCYEHTVCQPGLNLPAYLITVVQRIPRYLLLLRDLLERTPENHPDHSNLNKALGKMNHLAVYINNQLETVVGKRAMVELRSRVIGLKAFEVPGRALIREADVTLSGVKKTKQCLLFNDLLVFAVKGVTKTSEVEQTIELSTLWCMDLEGNNPHSPKEDSLEIFTPEKSYIMYVGTKNEKKVWLQKLRTAIAMVLHGSEATHSDEIERRKSKFTYKDGRTYWGNFVSGKRHGKGDLSWPNQTRYQGHWEDDDRNGRGDLTYNNGDKYSGDWLGDKQHGVGRMEYTNGDIYLGEWYQGDMHGMGEINFKNGDCFKGEFSHNEIQGQGNLSCVSGLIYNGPWNHSKKHGKGTMHFPNGDVYEGEFANDRISGQGEMQYADGSIYKGSWMNNQRYGNGEFSGSDGTHYLGGWSGDHITGKGCMTYSNGDCYDGLWFKNTRFGQGLMKYSNGDIYEGGFEYDLCNKHGTMKYKDGSEYTGNWNNGLRHGRGKMSYLNKSIYEGDWMYGMRHGEGTLTFAHEASYSGHWDLDKQRGRGMYNDTSTGYHYEGEWQDGRKNGMGVERTNEGSYEGEWKEDMRHGQGIEEQSCGTKFEGGWKENRKHGPGRKILKTGMVEGQVWQDGQLVEKSSIVLIELPLIQRR